MDVNKIKKDFPMFDTHPDLSYLDTTAMALRPISVINKMTEYYSNYGVNIHRGVYKLSYQATAEYDDARQVVAKFINAEENEIIFTRNTTESLNQVCLMYSKFLEKGDEIIVTELEHHSSLLPWQNLSKEKNLQLTYMPLNQEGRITVENFKKTISKNTKVLAITYISNVMGFITPLEEIIKLAHEHGIVVVVDAAQAVGHEQVDVKKLDCDFLAFSGHKMMGPTGIGVLFGKYKLLKKLTPVYYGGDMNENVSKFDLEIKEVPFRFEAGTPMIAEAIGLKEAINYIYEIGYDNINKYEKEIREYLFEKLKKISGITVYNPGSDIPLVTFNINGVHPHDAATLFDEQGICIRAGYHCAQLVSQWLGCEGSLRASFYIYNNKADVDKFVETIKTSVEFFSQFTGCTNE